MVPQNSASLGPAEGSNRMRIDSHERPVRIVRRRLGLGGRQGSHTRPW